MNIPMNDFHVTEKAMAETRRTTDARNIDLPHPNRLTNLQPGWILMKTEAIGSSITGGGAGRPGIDAPFSM
jgi:hypothetical protein